MLTHASHWFSIPFHRNGDWNYRITKNTGKIRFLLEQNLVTGAFFHSEKIAKYEIIYRETDLFFMSHRRKTKPKHFHIWYGQLSFYGYWILHYFSASFDLVALALPKAVLFSCLVVALLALVPLFPFLYLLFVLSSPTHTITYNLNQRLCSKFFL